jgi:hypothetical protein
MRLALGDSPTWTLSCSVARHGGKRLVVHEFPSLEAVEAWVEDVKANREQFYTLGDLTIISVPAI